MESMTSFGLAVTTGNGFAVTIEAKSVTHRSLNVFLKLPKIVSGMEPYYQEDMSNILIESAACGRPVSTSNQSGCREIVDNDASGIIVEQHKSRDVIEILKISGIEL